MNLDKDMKQLDKMVVAIWSLLTEARVYEAKSMTEELLRDVQMYEENYEHEKPPPLLENIAHAYHVAGYTASMSVRDPNAFVALQYYEKMECIAHDLRHATLYVIALTYRGDAYRRLGNLDQAKACLQKAYTYTPRPDDAALGNCAQLLGRIYFCLKDFRLFEMVMTEAEQIAQTIDQEQNSLHGQYCLGTVYIDYARSYHQLGQMQKAFDYLQQAEAVLPQSPHWQTLLIATRGLLLVRSGDFQRGMPDVVEAVRRGYEHGNQRLLDRFYALEQHLNKQAGEILEARSVLSSALERSFDF